MSKQNKVNPGTYTQAGRLTPDDAARELKKQREAASPKQTEGGQYGESVKARATTEDNQESDDESDDQDSHEQESDEPEEG